LIKNSLDAFLIKKRQNISYLTGTRGEGALLFVSRKKDFLLTDSLYDEEYKKSLKGRSLPVIKDMDVYAALRGVCGKTGSRRIGFEPDSISYENYSNLKKQLRGMTLFPLRQAIEDLRSVKDRGEIERVKKACLTGCDAMRHALSLLKPGIREIEVKNRVKEYILRKGIDLADFEIIVAFGKHCSMPHASASSEILRRHEMAMVDLGTRREGYNSDLTRTVFLGRINARFSHIYGIVLEAQKKAIAAVRPGVVSKDIDAISRKHITDKGLGRYFIHSLGHGIGLETHEEPRISPKSRVILRKNMVMTIEPGVYIPGWGGVRIEDVVMVTEKGCEVLTRGVDK